MSQCVEIFWFQQKVPFSHAKALSEDELYDLICRWQWVCFCGLTNTDTAKPIMEWVWVAIRFMKGFSVFWGFKFAPDRLVPRWEQKTMFWERGCDVLLLLQIRITTTTTTTTMTTTTTTTTELTPEVRFEGDVDGYVFKANLYLDDNIDLKCTLYVDESTVIVFYDSVGFGNF